MRRFRHRRLSSRLALLALLALAFQQLAFAAYACTLAEAPARATSAMDCMDAARPPAPPDALCHAQCNPDHSTSPDLRPATVPVPVLPPPLYAAVPSTLPADADTCASLEPHRSDPPPLQRFCRLLI